MKYTPAEITDALNGPAGERSKDVVSSILKDAKAGDARAIYMVALWHRDGLHGLEKNSRLYREYLDKAARKLLPEAIYEIGVSKDGKSNTKSMDAIGYYILAAALGDCDAIEAVADHFAYGDILEKNDFISTSLRMLKKRLIALDS